jgi:hypothetical protein
MTEADTLIPMIRAELSGFSTELFTPASVPFDGHESDETLWPTSQQYPFPATEKHGLLVSLLLHPKHENFAQLTV